MSRTYAQWQKEAPSLTEEQKYTVRTTSEYGKSLETAKMCQLLKHNKNTLDGVITISNWTQYLAVLSTKRSRKAEHL